MNTHLVTALSNNGGAPSFFEEIPFTLDQRGGMWISGQQQALNFRYRKSAVGYTSDWHVAGDPTLIIISQGTLRLYLRDGSQKDFSAGDHFIARDYLTPGSTFSTTHGHRAEVIGNQELHALHIKLNRI